MSDYEKIATALRYVQEHAGSQPNLDDIAAQVHLSPFHFHRLFSRWAGISPKRFLQVLTLEKAKALMSQSDSSVANISNEIGLSSGSRLYDHFVNIDAVTPSEFRQAGENLTISWAEHNTPFGKAFIAVTDRGICKFSFTDTESTGEFLTELRQEWPEAQLVNKAERSDVLVNRMFSVHHAVPDNSAISLLVRGTNFQINVWKALLRVKAGEIASYSDIAQAIGRPNSARAVGTAISSNPIAFIIPCHRVIQKNGTLGGYRWGTDRKHAILAMEAANSD